MSPLAKQRVDCFLSLKPLGTGWLLCCVVLTVLGISTGCASRSSSLPTLADTSRTHLQSVAPAATPSGGSTSAPQIVDIEVSQAVQQPNDYLPLTAHRDAYARVFVVGSSPAQKPPTVSLSVFSYGTLTGQYSIAPIASLPTSTDMTALESSLQNSYNLVIPGSAMDDGISMSASLTDSAGGQTYGSYSASGNLETFEQMPLFFDAYPVALTYINSSSGIVTQLGMGSPSSVDASYLNQVIPVPSVAVNVHQFVMSVDASKLYSDFNAGADETTLKSDRSALSLRILRDLATLPGQHPIGVLPANPILGALNGDAQMADMIQTADGNQQLAGLPSVFSVSGPLSTVAIARGFGSTYSVTPETNDAILNSTSCLTAYTNPDPYSSGSVQDIGIDLRSATVVSPSVPSIMADCTDSGAFSNWASDHYWQTLDFNMWASSAWPQAGSENEALEIAGQLSPSLSLGQPRLVKTAAVSATPGTAALRLHKNVARNRPSEVRSQITLPISTPTPATATLAGYAGPLQVFSVPVMALTSPTGEITFSSAIPLNQSSAANLTSITLTYGGSSVTSISRAAGFPVATAVSTSSGVVALTWNALIYPVVYVHGSNGSILELDAQNGIGQAQFPSLDTTLEVEFCDGVKSVYSTLPITSASPNFMQSKMPSKPN